MSHRVGALLLPAPPPPFGPSRPDEPNTAALDPALSILGQFFHALLEYYCGPAWDSIAPGEPIVRVLSVGFDPEDLDFSPESTRPLLALWRDKDAPHAPHGRERPKCDNRSCPVDPAALR
jgi:hypothetical protein